MRGKLGIGLVGLAIGCSGTDDPGLSGGAAGADAGRDVALEAAPVCESGQQVECACPGGSAGAQRCRDDGSGWETCICPDAAVDATPDAPADSTIEVGADAADSNETTDVVSDVSDEPEIDAPNDVAEDVPDGSSEDAPTDVAQEVNPDAGPCDGLPTSPYFDDEDSSGLDDCPHAYTEPFMAPFYEGSAAKSYSFYLVKPDGSEDRDFFSFSTFDTTDAVCPSGYYECFELEVQLTKEPDGADLEMCVYDIGNPGPGTACTNYVDKKCSNEGGNPANVVRIGYEGGCGVFDDDARQYVLEVFYAPGSAQSCDSYQVSIGWSANDPQPNACSF